MRNKNEFPRYSTLWQEYFMNILFRLCHKNHLFCIKIKPTIFVKMADDIPFDDSRLLCNPNGGDYNVVDVSTLEAQMIDFNTGRNPSITPASLAFKQNYIVPKIDENLPDDRKQMEERLARESSRDNSIPLIKNWLYPDFQHGINPVTSRYYLQTAKNLITFCFRVSQTFILQKVMNVKKSRSTLKRYESSVRIGVVAAAIVGSCYGFVEHSPNTTLESIKEDLDPDYTLEHYRYYSEYVLVLCRYIFTYIFSCKDCVNWNSVKNFKIGNMKSTHTRGRMKYGLWSNSFMSYLQIDGDNVSASVKMTRGHNFEMAKLLDCVLPGFWAKQSQVSRGYMLRSEHAQPNWEHDALYKNRLYPTSQNLYEGGTINRTNRQREIPSVKRALWETAISEPPVAEEPLPPNPEEPLPFNPEEALPVNPEEPVPDPDVPIRDPLLALLDDEDDDELKKLLENDEDHLRALAASSEEDGGGKQTPTRNKRRKLSGPNTNTTMPFVSP